MSDVTYALSFASMNSAIEAAKTRAANIQSLLDQMDKSSRGHLSGWTGDAQAAYEEAYATCRQVASWMPQTLESARQTLQSISSQYEAAESNVTKSFG